MATVKKHKFLFYGIGEQKAMAEQLDMLSTQGWELTFVNVVNNSVFLTLQITEFVK